MIELQNLTKYFGSLCAVDHVSMRIEKGEMFGIIGPSGAGKTTTMKIICGLLIQDEGEVLLDGESVNRGDKTRFNKIGYVPDTFGLYDNIKVSEYMEFFAAANGVFGKKGRDIYEDILRKIGLYYKRDSLTGHLSRGMKQKLCLARALVSDPDFLILDEPLLGLDPLSRIEVVNLLKGLLLQGKTIIISSHILGEISNICTSIALMKEGRVVIEGAMRDIRNSMLSNGNIKITALEKTEELIRLLREDERVLSVTTDGKDVHARFKGSEEEEALLLKSIQNKGILVSFFGRTSPSPEQIFLSMMEKEE